MEIKDKDLEKLGKLSALKIEQNEKEQLKLFLTKALSYFETIKQVDTENQPALLNPLSPPLNLRKDEILDFPDKNTLLDQAPKKQGALVKTPSSL